MSFHNPFKTLTKFEWALWLLSIIVIIVSSVCAATFQYLTILASLIGVTALIFVAKGDAVGQILTVIFSLIYAWISLRSHYYGEMITYLGMSAPIAMLSVVSWLRHPYEKGKNEVKIAHLQKQQIIQMICFSIVVTAIFYFILKCFHTANLIVSTISITTSFLASYLMFCRSSAYAIAYAANDVVLIVLWAMASAESLSYLPMAICFVMFFCNDLYGFYNWGKMKKAQHRKTESI